MVLHSLSSLCARVRAQAKFKQCGCMRDGARFVCVPPNRHYKCERVASVIKSKIQSEEEIRLQRYQAWEKHVSHKSAANDVLE
jgi:hypothetical protein